MSELFHRLTYRSACAPDLDGEALLGLLAHSRAANQRRHITGLLLVRGNRIMQILEGPAQAVTDLYAVIERDPRHQNVELLHTGLAERREFPDWAMGFIGEEAPPSEHTPFGLLDTSRQTWLLVRQANLSPATTALLARFVGPAVWMR